MAELTHLTDEELLARLRAAPELAPLAVELMGRLERALDEIDALATKEKPRAAQDQSDDRQGYLTFPPCQ